MGRSRLPEPPASTRAFMEHKASAPRGRYDECDSGAVTTVRFPTPAGKSSSARRQRGFGWQVLRWSCVPAAALTPAFTGLLIMCRTCSPAARCPTCFSWRPQRGVRAQPTGCPRALCLAARPGSPRWRSSSQLPPLGYAIWTTYRLPSLGRVAVAAEVREPAMAESMADLNGSAGAARAGRPAGPGRPAAPARATGPARPVAAVGMLVRAAAGLARPVATAGSLISPTATAGRPISPRLAACCEIALGVTMG
jgi:hypothetical protein